MTKTVQQVYTLSSRNSSVYWNSKGFSKLVALVTIKMFCLREKNLWTAVISVVQLRKHFRKQLLVFCYCLLLRTEFTTYSNSVFKCMFLRLWKVSSLERANSGGIYHKRTQTLSLFYFLV